MLDTTLMEHGLIDEYLTCGLPSRDQEGISSRASTPHSPEPRRVQTGDALQRVAATGIRIINSAARFNNVKSRILVAGITCDCSRWVHSHWLSLT